VIYPLPPNSGGAGAPAPPLLIPGIILELSVGDWSESIEVPGKIDTGAAQTIIPFSIAEFYGIPPSDSALIRGFDKASEPISYPVFPVRITVPGLAPKEISVVGCGRENILLGLDLWAGAILAADWNHKWFGYRRGLPIDRLIRMLF